MSITHGQTDILCLLYNSLEADVLTKNSTLYNHVTMPVSEKADWFSLEQFVLNISFQGEGVTVFMNRIPWFLTFSKSASTLTMKKKVV